MALFGGTKGGMPENSTYMYSPIELPEDNSLAMLVSMLYSGGKKESSSSKSSKSDEEGLRKVPALQGSGDIFVEQRNDIQKQKRELISQNKPLFEKYGSNPKAFLNSKEGREFQMKATMLSLQEREIDKNIPRLTQELKQWQTTEKKMMDTDEGNRIALDNKFNPIGTKYGGGKIGIGVNGYIPTTAEYLKYLDETPGGYDKDGYKTRPMPVVTDDNGEWEAFLTKQGQVAQQSMNEGAGRNVAMTGTGAGVLLNDKGEPTTNPQEASIGSTYNYLRTSKVGGNSNAVNTILKEYQDKMPTKARSDLMKQFWEDMKSGRLNEDLMMNKNGNVVERGGDYVYSDDERAAIKSFRQGNAEVNAGVIEGIKNRYTHLRVYKDLDLYRKSTYDPYFLNAGSPGDYKEKYPEASWQQTIADPAVITTNNDPKPGKLNVTNKNGNYEAKTVTIWDQDIPLFIREGFKQKYFFNEKGVPTVDLMNYITNGVVLGDGTILEPGMFASLNADNGDLVLPILDMVGTTAMPKIQRDPKTGYLTRMLTPYKTSNGREYADVESFIKFNVFVEDLDKIPALRAKKESGSGAGTFTWEGDESNNEEYWKAQTDIVKPVTINYYDNGKLKTKEGYSVEMKITTPTSQPLTGTSEVTFNQAKGNAQFTNFSVMDAINEAQAAQSMSQSKSKNQLR